MGKVKRTAFFLAAFVLACGSLYLLVRVGAGLQQAYPWEEMDWSGRGRTSIWDLMAASDVGRREIEVNGKKCNEYFAYKDGLPLKVVCSK